MTQVTSPEASRDTQAQQPQVTAGPVVGLDDVRPAWTVSDPDPGAADLTRIRYGAWLIIASFLLLGTVFGVAIWRYRTASDVAAVIGTLATVTGTILGAFFGAQVGSAGKDAAEAGRRKAERTAQMALGKLEPSVAHAIVREL